MSHRKQINIKHTNMKTYKVSLLIILLIFFLSNRLNSQSKDQQRWLDHHITELNIKDSIILRGIDSFILNSSCKKIRDSDSFKYFNIVVDRRSSNNYTFFHFILYNRIMFNHKKFPIGYFDYKGYTFFIFEYYPKEIFINSDRKKRFTYYQNNISYTSSPDEWGLKLENNEIELEFICCR